MLVSDLFQTLSFGELSNLSMSSGGGGTIADSKKPQVLQFINAALLRLHSRFVLRENSLILQQDTTIRNYRLSSKFAVTAVSPPTGQVQFIIDTVDAPFTDDVIKVLVAFDEFGCELPINDSDDCRSIFTPSPYVVQVPSPIGGLKLGIGYQAKHPKLTAYTDTIDLPETLIDALTAYVGYLAYCGVAGDGGTAKSQEFLALYEARCAEVTQMDLVNSSSSTTNTRFHKGGWP